MFFSSRSHFKCIFEFHFVFYLLTRKPQDTTILGEEIFQIHKNPGNELLAAPYAPLAACSSTLDQALVTDTVKARLNCNLQYF